MSTELHATARLLRDWPSAAEHADRALGSRAENGSAESGASSGWISGKMETLFLCKKPPPNFDRLRRSGRQCGLGALGRGDALAGLHSGPGCTRQLSFRNVASVLSAPVPKTYLEGLHLAGAGQNARARASSLRSRARRWKLKQLLIPTTPSRHARLGLLYAYMGQESGRHSGRQTSGSTDTRLKRRHRRPSMRAVQPRVDLCPDRRRGSGHRPDRVSAPDSQAASRRSTRRV